MKNLEEISRFQRCEPGTGLELPGARRRVRLELNTAAPCQLKIQTGAKDLRFLANVDGRETLVFIADGPVTIWPDCEDEVWWWCSEMETTAMAVPGAKTYTKIANRRARNPELERVAAKMAENADRRMRQMLAEFGGTLRAVQAENETLKTEVKRGKRKSASPAAASGADDLGEAASEAAEGNDSGGGDAAD